VIQSPVTLLLQSMLQKIALITALATTAFVFVPTPEAQACKSNWMKLSDTFKKVSPTISKGICKAVNKDDVAAANKCIEDYEKAVAAADKIIKEYNADAGSGKIGPRGLGTNRWYTGALQAERTFIGLPILSDEYTVEFKGDGGKAKSSYTVQVCFVDQNGDKVIEPFSKTFNNNNGSFKRTFKGVYGARPMIYLKSAKASTNAHKYKLYVNQGGLPQIVVDAQNIANQRTLNTERRTIKR
jgi:hypothetical protein